ncbi:MAG TPA: hypothetical protein VEA69_13695 [Tepidisphaeraceae bacterium]|nr:hypothetical protein [Tepidisphaeraceae bacterium]
MHKFTIKLFLDDPKAITDAQVVPLFHTWIQGHLLADHGLIDVADYAHVHHGPGVVLVSHEANIYLDHQDGRSGLVYQRKQPIAGAATLAEAIAGAVRYTLATAQQLEVSTEGKAKFGTGEVSLKFADRLNAPNTPETFATVRGAVESGLTPLLGPVTLKHNADPAKLLEVTITSAGGKSVSDLLQTAAV